MPEVLEPADLRRPYRVDLARMRGDIEAISLQPSAESLAGVEVVDPVMERVADMVADAAAAAVAAQAVKGATVESVRSAARAAAKAVE